MSILSKKHSFLTKSMIDEACASLQETNLEPLLHQTLSYIQSYPIDPSAWRLRGLALYKAGDPFGSIQAFQESLHHDPSNVYTMANLAFSLLSVGAYEEGWQWAEKSTLYKQEMVHRYGGTYWSGEPVTDLYIIMEEGWGDTIQFLRFLQPLSDRVTRFHGISQHTDLSLFPCLEMKNFPGFSSLISLEELQNKKLLQGQKAVFLSSLPLILKTTLPTIPIPIPYLNVPRGTFVDEAKNWSSILNRWQQKDKGLPSQKLRVGLVWRGREDRDHNESRSCPPEVFRPLSSLPHVEWISLQKENFDDSFPKEFPLQKPPVPLTEWAQTLCVMETLDLIISVDTAVAHAAGALGKPVWLLHSFSPDWRWMHEKESSCWYPTVRIFRAPHPGDWASVIDNVRQAFFQKSNSLLEKRASFHTQNQAPRSHSYGGSLWQKALTQNPLSPEVHGALASFYEAEELLSQAQIHKINQAQVCESLTPDVLLSASELALKRGFYETGVELIAASLLSPDQEKDHRDSFQKALSLQEPLSIIAKGSLRDLIPWIPCLLWLCEKIPVTFYGPPSLISLLRETPGLLKKDLNSLEEPLPDQAFDLREIPYLIQKSGGSFLEITQQRSRFLSPPALSQQRYARRQIQGFNIGIGWRGSEGFSFPFQEFMPLFFIPGIQWINLDQTEDASGYTAPIFRLNPPLKSIEDLAAFLTTNIDLVITADMELAPLAAGLGLPIWVICPPKGHWVWGENSPEKNVSWYGKEVRVFHQTPREIEFLYPTCRPLKTSSSSPPVTVFKEVYEALLQTMRERYGCF